MTYFLGFLFISQFSALRPHTEAISYNIYSSLLTFLKGLLHKTFACITWPIYTIQAVVHAAFYIFKRETIYCFAFFEKCRSDEVNTTFKSQLSVNGRSVMSIAHGETYCTKMLITVHKIGLHFYTKQRKLSTFLARVQILPFYCH
jgi:hypothetical protein